MRTFILLLLTFWCAGSALGEERFVFEGVFDVPLLEGTFIPEDCKTGTPFGSDYLQEEYACIAYPFEQEGNSPEWNYVRALDQAGWAFAGGAGNVYYLEKPVSDECSERMYMIGVIQGDPAEVAKWGGSEEGEMDWSKIRNGIYQFVLEPEKVCGDARHQKDKK